MPLLPLEPFLFPDDLLSGELGQGPVEGPGCWWVLHTRPRAEKSLARSLLRRNHPFFLPRTVPTAWFADMAAHGAVLEICANIAQPMAFHQGGGMLLGQVADLVTQAGVDQCIVATDAGQPYSPWPDEELRAFVNCLFDVGMDESTIRRLVSEKPARLLGLD